MTYILVEEIQETTWDSFKPQQKCLERLATWAVSLDFWIINGMKLCGFDCLGGCCVKTISLIRVGTVSKWKSAVETCATIVSTCNLYHSPCFVSALHMHSPSLRIHRYGMSGGWRSSKPASWVDLIIAAWGYLRPQRPVGWTASFHPPEIDGKGSSHPAIRLGAFSGAKC